jgi:anti-sigma regulatory factor (Ser/Thr protein kinase)
MNGRTGTVTAGLAPGLTSGMHAAAVRPAPAEGKQRPGLRPWPLFSALGPMGALPTAPGLARAFTALMLGSWDLAGAGDLALAAPLIVTEFATNVIQAATGGDGSLVYHDDGRPTVLWLRLMSDRARLLVEVWDNLPATAGVPVLRSPTGEEEHGRGLTLVNELSQRWGWSPIPGGRAKAVWALLKAC